MYKYSHLKGHELVARNCLFWMMILPYNSEAFFWFDVEQAKILLPSAFCFREANE